MARLRLSFAAATGLILLVFPPLEGPAAPGKIGPSLLAYLERSSPEEMIPIVMILERQVTEEEKSRLFSKIETGDKLRAKRRKRELLIQELKRVAMAEQSGLLELLKSWEANGHVQDIRPLWLSNVIGLETRRSALKQLAAFPGIQSIHLDIPRPVLGEVASGVARIQAPQVWSGRPGYDGTGVVVAILDTGVSYRHSDLKGRMWINSREDRGRNGVDDDRNGYVDDVRGWNFADRNNDPNDPIGHGTHVAGTVSGDGTGGTLTGVAPGARIMALRESDTTSLFTQRECWEGMQYALANGADILNFSAGWLDEWDPVYATWRTIVKNLMDGGVLFVTITHNDANEIGAPDNVRTPGRVPAGLTVGATDDSDKIADFSNHGPVTWRTVSPFLDYLWGPGLRKPDVVAPGVNVKSTLRTGGYGLKSGTSMAAPHVAGLAALLLDKAPALNPYELRLIIEETSAGRVATGPDNVFGWGRIDAPAAIRYRISPVPYDLATDRTGKDIWVDNDDNGSPDDLKPGRNNHLYARIHNLGGQMVSDAEVRFYSLGAGRAGCGSGPRTQVGSYRIPILGPESSRHGTALAAIHWMAPTTGPWCVGIEVAAHLPNPRERRLTNNTGFRAL